MAMYVLRRVGISLLILLVTSFVVYQLLAISGDPLAEFRASSDPNAERLMAARIEQLNLNEPPPIRYFTWLTGVAGCAVPGIACDMGYNLAGQEVSQALGSAMTQTLRMVVIATFLSMLIGTTLGIITALRQYSAFDYGTTFLMFLCFSLPSFWVAVLLKEFMAIQFNAFLKTPQFGIPFSLTISLILAVIVAAAIGGGLKKILTVTAVGTAISFGVLQLVSFTGWLSAPYIWLPGIALFGVGTAFGMTALIAGLRNRRALYSGLAVVGIALALYMPMQYVFPYASFWLLAGLGILTIVVSSLVGHFMGGYDRGQNRAVAAITGVVVAGLTVLDHFMQWWPTYYNHSRINQRPIATLGAQTPGFNENFWLSGLDVFTHVLLPTTALMLIGLAAYARYARATMLEVMNQDYVRTARAKGLSERVVIVRHAFRNALVPIATVVAMTIGGVLSGAIITERIFSWSGMGTMFITGLTTVDPNPVMAVFLVTSSMALAFIIVADIAYSFLDPRVRVK